MIWRDKIEDLNRPNQYDLGVSWCVQKIPFEDGQWWIIEFRGSLYFSDNPHWQKQWVNPKQIGVEATRRVLQETNNLIMNKLQMVVNMCVKPPRGRCPIAQEQRNMFWTKSRRESRKLGLLVPYQSMRVTTEWFFFQPVCYLQWFLPNVFLENQHKVCCNPVWTFGNLTWQWTLLTFYPSFTYFKDVFSSNMAMSHCIPLLFLMRWNRTLFESRT